MASKNTKAGAPKSIPTRAAYPVAEAAVLLGGTGPSTLRRWINLGRVRAVRVGGRPLIPASEIARLTRLDGVA